MDSFDKIPLELWIIILSHHQEYSQKEDLPLKEILDLGLVCKKWYQAIKYINFDLFIQLTLDNSLYIKNILKLKIKKISIYIENFQNVEILKKINQVCRNIKNVELILDEDIFFENTKLIINTLTNIDSLCFNNQDIFSVEKYNNSFFPHNDRLKELQLISANINSQELHSLVKKFPNLNELLLQECLSVDSELFEEDMDIFKNIKTLAITVSKEDYCFNPEDIEYVMESFKGLTKLYVNHDLYSLVY